MRHLVTMSQTYAWKKDYPSADYFIIEFVLLLDNQYAHTTWSCNPI